MRPKNQYGRSMVEMLGVLSIIGVLSAGALAGYQKAMREYQLNQFSDSFRMFMADMFEMSTKLPYAKENEWITSFVAKMKNYEPFLTYRSQRLYDKFGNKITVMNRTNQRLILYSWENDEKMKPVDLCERVVRICRENASELYYVSINRSANSMDKTVEGYRPVQLYGKFYGDYKGSGKYLKDLSVLDIKEVCSQCDGDGCRAYIIWK